VLRIINEPTAAAIAYGLNLNKEQTTLVYDLGGGTFDVTIIKITPDSIKVIGTDGDHELGGKNWDDRIINYVAHKFEEEFGTSLVDDPESINDMLVRAERQRGNCQQGIKPVSQSHMMVK
jgi:molecular chaperone DnaK